MFIYFYSLCISVKYFFFDCSDGTLTTVHPIKYSSFHHVHQLLKLDIIYLNYLSVLWLSVLQTAWLNSFT
jgi:hypothetical protein